MFINYKGHLLGGLCRSQTMNSDDIHVISRSCRDM